MKELNKYFKNEAKSIEGATIIYGAVKELKGLNTSNTRNQITRNLRFIHAYWFFAPSVQSEKVANRLNLSFKNITYHKSYQYAKKIKGHVFVREHINGGTQFLSEYLIDNYASFKSTNEILDWIIENTFIVLRLKTEKDTILKDSKYEEIKDLISE